MDLLNILFHKLYPAAARVSLHKGAGRKRALRNAEMPFEQLHQLVRRKAARAGDDNIFRHIMRLLIGKQRLARHRADALLCAEDGKRQRIALEEQRACRLRRNILRAVLGHEDLLQHDAALFLQFFGVECAVEHKICEHIGRDGQMLVQHLCIKTGTFL